MVPYLQKGRLVALQGEFELETWMDRQNQVHPIAHLTSPVIELLDANKAKDEEPAATTPSAEIDPDELPFE
jgi:single-stranded DNA-binding protein